MFSFHILNNWNNNIETNEIAFYENICNDLDYYDSDEKENKKRNKEKNNRIYDEEMIEKNIKNVMNKNTHNNLINIVIYFFMVSWFISRVFEEASFLLNAERILRTC